MKLKDLLQESTSYDARATQQQAQKIQAALDKLYKGYFDSHPNGDGSITFSQNGGAGGLNTDDNPYILNPKNLSKVIDPFFRSFREEGWTFTQPVSGKFTIGVPEASE